MEKAPPARKRTSTQVRTLILEAARQLFSASGYAATTTRDIATAAGVAEPLIFRHFGTKSDLFERAVLLPVQDFIEDYVSDWEARVATGQLDETGQSYIGGLYDCLHANRDLLFALLAARAHPGPDLEDLASRPSPLADLLTELEGIVHHHRVAAGRTLDAPLAVRFTFSIALSMALFGDVMFPGPEVRPSRTTLISEMASYMLHGVDEPRRVARRGTDSPR